MSDPPNREIDFDFDFDSFVRAGEAKLCGCVRDASSDAGAPDGKLSSVFSSARFFSLFLLLITWFLKGFSSFCLAFAVCCMYFLWFLRPAMLKNVVFTWILQPWM